MKNIKLVTTIEKIAHRLVKKCARSNFCFSMDYVCCKINLQLLSQQF